MQDLEEVILRNFESKIKNLKLPYPYNQMIKEVKFQIGTEWSIDENKILTFPFDFDQSEEGEKDFRTGILHELTHLLLGHPFYTPKHPLARYFYEIACEIEVACFLKERFKIPYPIWLSSIIKNGWPSAGKLIKVQGKDAFELTYELLEDRKLKPCFNKELIDNQKFLRKTVFQKSKNSWKI
ncbi:hypothetical protein J7L36_02325 [bacterium]|nr:hypothetical protein [bacterium]